MQAYGDIGGGSEPYEQVLKLVLMGSSSVGKSSLMVRFTTGRFETDLQPTTGAAFASHPMTLQGNRRVLIHLWDTAGQECYRSLTRQHFRGAAGALLVYDKTSRASFESIPSWIEDLYATVDHSIVMMLVGNKSDLADSEQVTREEGEQFAREHKLLFLETSAWTGTNVGEAFAQLATQALEHLQQTSPMDLASEDDVTLDTEYVFIDGAPQSASTCLC